MPADERRGSLPPSREPVSLHERRRWLLALVVLGIVAILLRLRALEVGLLSDDFMQWAMIDGLYPGDGYAPFDLYAFVRVDADLAAHVDKGSVPWFAEPDFHGAVLRPLASLLLWLDHAIAPGKIRLWHAHSLVWLGFVIIAFGLAARRLLPRLPAAIAVALLVCEAGFVSPVGWLANRCVLICAAFGFLAIFVHLEWRRPDPSTPIWLRRHGPIIELGLLAAAFGGGEYSLGVVAYLFAWELLVPREAWRTRMRALVPAAIAAVTYLVVHKLFGYGTFGADVYADPVHAPLGWLKWAKFRLPKLCAAALWAVPAETISVFEHPGAAWWQARWPATNPYEAHFSHMRMGIVGIALASAALVLARAGLHPDERKTLQAMVLGALLGILPVSVAPAHSRLLIITQLGACAVIATLACACLHLLRTPGHPLRRARGAALALLVAPMLMLNTWFDLRWSQRYMLHLDGIAEADILAFTEGDLLEQELEGRDVIVLNGPSQAVAMYGHFVLHGMGEPVPATWRSIGLGGEHPMFALRRSADTLDVTAIQGAWLQTAGELFFRRAEQPLPTGDELSYPGFEIEILADDGEGRPTTVRFKFPHDLDDPRYLFLTSTPEGLTRWQVPAIERSAVVPVPRLPFPIGLD